MSEPQPRGRSSELVDWNAMIEQQIMDILFWDIVKPSLHITIWSDGTVIGLPHD